MTIGNNRLFAVLTGDVINSSGFNPGDRDRLHAAILDAGHALNQTFPAELVGDLSLYRGDSLQLLLNQPGHALRLALFLRACLKSACTDLPIDLRLSIGIGTVDFLPSGTMGGADGEAYRLSGPALDGLDKRQTLCLSLGSFALDGPLEPLTGLVMLVGALADSWSVKQAAAIKGALHGLTHEQIAAQETEPISRQAVSKRLDAAHWFAIEQALILFETSALLGMER